MLLPPCAFPGSVLSSALPVPGRSGVALGVLPLRNQSRSFRWMNTNKWSHCRVVEVCSGLNTQFLPPALALEWGQMGRLFQRLAGLDLYRKNPALRYGLALLFVLAALAGTFLPVASEKLPFIFFFGAIALTARLCGFGPALMATVLSGILANFFFLPPHLSLRFGPDSPLQMLLFFLVSLLITSVALQKSVAQTEALESRDRLAETLKTITEGFITYSSDWTITYVNPSGAQLCGVTPEKITGRNVWERFPDLVGTTLEINFKAAMREQKPVHFDMHYPPLNRWYRVAGYPGQYGLTAIFHDISETRQTADALLTTERRLQFAQVAGRLGSWEWNVRTNELWWAEGIWVLHGRPIGSVAPTFENWLAFVDPDDRESTQRAVQQALEGKGNYETEYRTTWPDGSVHWIVARGQVVCDEAGQPERMLGIGMDITDRKLAEDALRKSEKLAAAGRSGRHHRARNQQSAGSSHQPALSSAPKRFMGRQVALVRCPGRA